MFSTSVGCRIVFGVTVAIGLAVCTTGVYIVESIRLNPIIIGGLVSDSTVEDYYAIASRSAKLECEGSGQTGFAHKLQFILRI